MILADTSVWIHHLRADEPKLVALLDAKSVLMHPFVIGELSIGNLCHRDVVLGTLHELPRSAVAEDYEVLQFIDRHSLFGLGIGYIDVHLLAAVQLTPGTSLWTRDRRLFEAADRLGLAADLPHWSGHA